MTVYIGAKYTSMTYYEASERGITPLFRGEVVVAQLLRLMQKV